MPWCPSQYLQSMRQSLFAKVKTARRSLSEQIVPLLHTGKLPLYRIQVPSNFRDLLTGTTLGGNYWVLKVIGRGGMSVVYKAKSKRSGEVVAIKTLRTAGLTDEMLVKRFQREAELLSLLNHPRIVNLHAYGTSNKGQPYFVMDYLEGENLTDILKREDHLSIERFQDIFVQVCAAIEHAHRHGAVHRDIKQGNIMLTRQGKTFDYVKVVDFGIAKMAEEAQKLTRMGEVWGSPIYMSPEQCMGATLDARSDIYSLGIVMYESLTGRVPFLGKNYADTMTKQIADDPPRFKQMRPDLQIPESFEAVINRALAKKPEDRYQSMTTMRKDLESALSLKSAVRETKSTHPAVKAHSKIKHLQEEFEMDFSPVTDAKPRLPKKSIEQSKLETRELASAKTKSAARKTSPKTTSKKAKTRKKKDREREAGQYRLILAGMFSLTISIIAIFLISNSQTVTTVMAEIAKMLLSGTEDDGDPYKIR